MSHRRSRYLPGRRQASSPPLLYAAESLERRRLLAGVTLIAHGFGADSTGWVTAMADAIFARADLADRQQIRYTVTVTDPGDEGGPLDVSVSPPNGASVTASATDDPEVILLLEWSTLAGTATGAITAAPWTSPPPSPSGSSTRASWASPAWR